MLHPARSFELPKNKSIGKGLRILMRSELAECVHVLQQRNDSDLDHCVHETRKACKRVRGMLRLVRPAVGSAVFHYANGLIRDVARPLSELRDAAVLIATLDDVTKGESDFQLLESVAKTSEQLVARKKWIHDQLLHDPGPFQKIANILESLCRADHVWAPKGVSQRDVLKGLRKTYQAGREAFRKTQVERSVESLHAWRKQAKYLRYQCEALGPLAPAAFEGLAKQANTLGELLGLDHDLAVLLASISAESIGDPSQKATATLTQRIQQRRLALESEADVLGNQLFAPKPSSVIRGLKRAITTEQSVVAK